MANLKITELPAATLPIATGTKFEAVQGGLNVQVDADDMPGSGAAGVTSVTGTTNRITSTGGATPVIDIDAAYDAAITAQISAAVPDASATTKGIVELATPAEVITGTSTVLAVTPEGFAAGIAPYVITEVSAVTTGGTITLNFQVSSIDRQNVIFIGSASFTGAKTIAMSNTTSAKNFAFVFEITSFAGASLTVPADWSLSSPDFTTGTTWTPTANGRYRMTGFFANSLWEVFVDGQPASV